MIRENQKYINRIRIILDGVCIIGSFLLAFYIRFFTEILPEGRISVPFNEAIKPFVYMIPVYLLIYNVFELYIPRRTKSVYREVLDIVKANVIGIMLLTMFLFVYKLVNISRYMLILFFIINVLATIIIRIGSRMILRRYRKKGYNLKHCLVVGATDLSESFLLKIKKNNHWGYEVIGILDNKTSKKKYMEKPILGKIKDLGKILSTHLLDVVIIAISNEDYDDLGYIISQCEKAGVKTHIIPYYYKHIPAKPYMDDLDGIPIIDTRHVPLDNVIRNLSKRIFDIIFSLIAITLVSPILIFSAIMVKLTSKGPIIYKQERVGLNRKNFNMYKFRSMKVQDVSEEKSQWTTKDDPRKTKWGTFMRKTSIDELPQFFNVLFGHMSVVGPRPERPYFVDKFKEEIPKYMIKHQVRPGITGWAQVNGWRGDTSIAKRIECDIYYIENWTFSMDIKIIFMTVFKGFVNKNAY